MMTPSSQATTLMNVVDAVDAVEQARTMLVVADCYLVGVDHGADMQPVFDAVNRVHRKLTELAVR